MFRNRKKPKVWLFSISEKSEKRFSIQKTSAFQTYRKIWKIHHSLNRSSRFPQNLVDEFCWKYGEITLRQISGLNMREPCSNHNIMEVSSRNCVETRLRSSLLFTDKDIPIELWGIAIWQNLELKSQSETPYHRKIGRQLSIPISRWSLEALDTVICFRFNVSADSYQSETLW